MWVAIWVMGNTNDTRSSRLILGFFARSQECAPTRMLKPLPTIAAGTLTVPMLPGAR